MCGRYTVDTDENHSEMRDYMREAESRLIGDMHLKTGEIFPTDLVPVITQDGVVPMVWGFPRWNGGGVVINARAETAAEKKMFRSSLFFRRLVVPSTGFFEWQRVKGRKQKDKYLIRQPDAPLLYMAGLFNYYKLPDGSEEPRFVILTTASGGGVAALHDRMPVILSREEIGDWLVSGEAVGRILDRAGPELTLNKTP